MSPLNHIIKDLLNIDNFTPTLDDVQTVIAKLSLIPTYSIILVGGTNGKGSTCAYLTNILSLAGYKVGTYTSPHMFQYNERIAINNQPIDDSSLLHALTYIKHNCQHNLGLFHTFTLAAHWLFCQQHIDIAIIEVGLGGRLDTTNLFEPTISAITNVDYDHCDILGNTLEKIGLEKAGIFRANKHCFFANQAIPKTIIDYAWHIGAKLQIFGTDFSVNKHELCFDFLSLAQNFYSIPYPSLRGSEQINNACLAIAILQCLPQFPVSINIIKTGLSTTKLYGRFQILAGTPQRILDVAHNPHAVSTMLKNMLKLPFAKNNYAVFGIACDKDIDSIIYMCRDTFTKWFIAKINSQRGLSTKQIIAILIKHGIAADSIIECESVAIAVNHATKIAKNEDRIICFGSFLVVEEAYKII